MSESPLNPYDRDALRDKFQSAEPFPYIILDEFIRPSLVDECVAAYPSYDEARSMGREFGAVNERLKVQVTEAERFASPVAALNAALASPEFLADLEHITGIKNLLADPELSGGGMHIMGGQGGRLDVHVDFNYNEQRNWHRRLNLLVYMNPEWEKEWGGAIELWNSDVSKCYESVVPLLNKCLIFETSEISYHGVTPLAAPKGVTRKSFAAYYYTREAPEGYDGTNHTTIFRSRPDEKFRGKVLVPAERAKRSLVESAQKAKGTVKRLLGR